MGAMPIAAWDLQATPITFPSLRWSSNWGQPYLGPPGQVSHHRMPDTGQAVFKFEIRHPARFVFQYTLDANDEHVSPNQLRDVVKDMVYIK